MMAILAVIFSFVACDEDFNTVGSEVITGVGFERETYVSTPIAYNREVESVQTSGLPYYFLGTYEDPVYGRSNYDILSQVRPSDFTPDFKETDKLEGIYLELPYFSTRTNTTPDENGDNTYRLDSVYGNQPTKVSVYRSNYFLRDFEITGDNDRKRYFSDDISEFGEEVESILLGADSTFVPSPAEIKLERPDGDDTDTLPDIERLTPRLRIKLEDNLFEILKKGEAEGAFANPNTFTNFFRGIYIKSESESTDGNLFAFDLRNAQIKIEYTKEDKPEELLNFSLNFFGGADNNRILLNAVNGIEKENTDVIIPEPDTEKGNENLYLQGGAGSYAVIELFGRQVATDENGDFRTDQNGKPVFLSSANTSSDAKTELDFLRSQNWLVNNAMLKVYVDQDKLGAGGDNEPDRIYIFDVESGIRLADFCADPTLASSTARNAVVRHLSALNRGTNDKGEFYEINIPRHVVNLLNSSTNTTKLGIAVSQNVLGELSDVQNCLPAAVGTTEDDEIIPFTSIISPRGTILYGNTEEVPEDKRLQLEISYSKPVTN